MQQNVSPHHSRSPLAQAVLIFIIMLLLFLLALLFATPMRVSAQAATNDKYEDNDTMQTASNIPTVVTLPNMTVFPAGDADYWRVLASPGPLNIKAIGTPGLDLTMSLVGPDGAVVMTHNDPAGPNASLSTTAPTQSYYVIEVTSTTQVEGFYQLEVYNMTPTQTPIPTATRTPTSIPQPTNPPPFVPSATPTPDLGNPPDRAEPNYDFAHAFRIVPGDELKSLNFNSGSVNSVDNDFFVMAVRGGVSYTCQTADLGPNTDTNMIIYHSANTSDLVGGNDDEDIQNSKINSKISFTAVRDGDVYVLIGYKYPTTEPIRYPGNATYTLTCSVGASPTPAPSGAGGSSGGASGAPSGAAATPTPNATAQATPLSIVVVNEPEIEPTEPPQSINTMVVDIVVAYDLNGNKQPEPNEGVHGLSVRIIELPTNREISHAFTDGQGHVQFVIATNNRIQVVIPFLAVAKEFNSSSDAQYIRLITPVNHPGLIP